MNVSLSRQLQGFIEKKIRRGRYQTACEVVYEGLRLIEDRDTQRALQLRRLPAYIKVGLDQVDKREVATLGVKKIKAEGRKRLAARGPKDVG